MSDDMTYEPVTDWRRVAQDANQYALGMEAAANEQAARVAELERSLAQADSNMVALAARNAELAARVQELEPSGFAMANSALIQRVRQLERENAELRARLEAVPVEAIRRIVFDDKRSFGVIRAEQTVAGWLATFDTQHTAQPDDTDAPLKLAALDEDGDE